MNLLNSLITFAADKIPAGTVGIPQVSADTVLQNALYIVYYAAGFVAIICIIIGAIVYTTAGSKEGNVTKGKDMIFYSVIGLIVVGIAFIITRFVIGRF